MRVPRSCGCCKMRGVLRLRVRKLVVESDSRLFLIPFLRGNLRNLCAFFASKIFSHHEARHSKSSPESAPQENTSLDQNSRLVVLTNVPKKPPGPKQRGRSRKSRVIRSPASAPPSREVFHGHFVGLPSKIPTSDAPRPCSTAEANFSEKGTQFFWHIWVPNILQGRRGSAF